MAAKAPQHRKIVANHPQEDLGTKIIPILRRKTHAARLGRVPNHVQHQAHEAVDKIFPRPGPLLKAALQQTSVDLRESHAIGPLVTNNGPFGIAPGIYPKNPGVNLDRAGSIRFADRFSKHASRKAPNLALCTTDRCTGYPARDASPYSILNTFEPRNKAHS